MEAMANFVPKLGLAKVYPINDEERTFEQIVAKAKVVFDEAVERNFIKRRPLVEIYLEPRDPQNGQSCLKVFFQGEPDCSLYAVSLPRISLEFDFEAMRAFATKRGINVNGIFISHDPIADFYDTIFEKNLLDDWQVFRKDAYSLLFENWVNLCTNDIYFMTNEFQERTHASMKKYECGKQ